MAEPKDFGYAVLGGFLVSLGCSAHIYFRQRTTGFNGMVYSIISCDKPSLFWKLGIICSMIVASGIMWNSCHFSSYSDTSPFFDSPSYMISDLSLFGFALAGFLVGFGAKLSNGCTSGHLFCGIPRRSIRSLVAVIVYMISAFVFAYLRTENPFLYSTDDAWVEDNNYNSCVNVVTAISGIILIWMLIYFKLIKKIDEMFHTILVSILVGVLFAFGLIFGGLNRRSKVMGFLNFWDESLIVFFGSVIIFNLIIFYYLFEHKHKVIIESPSSKITWRLIFGSVIFGIGWALGGICPGPSFILFMFLTPHISLIWIPCLALGQACVILFEKCINNIQECSGEDRLLNYE